MGFFYIMVPIKVISTSSSHIMVPIKVISTSSSHIYEYHTRDPRYHHHSCRRYPVQVSWTLYHPWFWWLRKVRASWWREDAPYSYHHTRSTLCRALPCLIPYVGRHSAAGISLGCLLFYYAQSHSPLTYPQISTDRYCEYFYSLVLAPYRGV